MRLLLSLLTWPDGGKPDMRAIDAELAIGRGRESGWVLPDPASQLSRRHCLLVPFAEGWRVTDLSLNGTFVNDSPAPLGREQSYELHDGDRIRIGSYVIEARYQVPEILRVTEPNSFAASPNGYHEPFPHLGASPEAFPPVGFDPLGGPRHDDFPGRPAADHSPAFTDAWQMPRPGRVVIPESWDLEEPVAAPEQPSPAPAPANNILGDDFDPFEPPVADAAAAPVLPQPVSVAPTPAEPVVADAPPSPHTPGLLAAFLRGAGLRDTGDADPLALMEAAGAMLRAMTQGLREIQASRGQVKRTFRILATVVDPADNNPIKFSATPETALRALLTGNRPPAAAVTEVLNDIRLHELAMIAAMQEAVRGLLDTLDPASLRANEQGIASVLPVQRKARAFEQYEALYARTMQAMTDDFDSVFGKAFARAYERVALADENPPTGAPR